ncbi:MAG: hypothetical protein QY323_04545 [Patescibacteria group bacterium]|nr:MAG: hypothetical protein QY323_04545 [Patescibacteria group bacterium]
MVIETFIVVSGVCIGYAVARFQRRHQMRRQKQLLPSPRPVPELPPPDERTPGECNAQFKRMLEACGFRIFQWGVKPGRFENGSLTIANREFEAVTPEMHGWRIAYKLPVHTECCNQYYWWRLAQPFSREERVPNGLMDEIVRHEGPGLGPRVCAKCGRIERDYDGALEGVGGFVGRAKNIFPVLNEYICRERVSADHARLAILRQESNALERRRYEVMWELVQLEHRLGTKDNTSPYRDALSSGVDQSSSKEDDPKKLPRLRSGQYDT